ncbi:MAG: adenylate/guanylate cyclase domain-containing protein [Proteobacteria bacterium]|nr:adenylate/guanylate cyclase domain-containing protein [Pseudomonadota bacterium]MBU1714881.1 adenylate/guanylate cyclase domain-containing protein [Pseudomonadota bacterium]
MKNNKILIRCLCLALVGVITFWFYYRQIDVVQKFSLLTEDIKYLVRSGLGKVPEADPSTMIVAIDEHSVNELGRWPWDRKVMAELIGKLSGASIVCLDIVFSEPTNPASDRLLAKVFADNGNVITGFFFRPTASQKMSAGQLDILHDSAYSNFTLLDEVAGVKEFPAAELNIPEIDQAALAHAFFSTEPDLDGLYRRYPLVFTYRGYLYPPLAIQMVRFHRNRQAALTLDRDGICNFEMGEIRLQENYFGLNFYDPAQSTMISAVDVLRGKVGPERFKDALVLIGITESGVFDLRPTPVDPVIPGVWIHYTALNNLLNNEMLHGAPGLDYLLIALALAFIFLASRIRLFTLRFLCYFGVLGAILVLANYLHIVHNLWVHEFYPLAGVFLLAASLEATAFFFTERRASTLKKAFSSYVSPALVGEIMANPDHLVLGGTEREISILFSDIRGFTSLSEQVTPGQLVEMLTAVHNPMTNIILKNMGLLDKYIGDAMMALFNAPLDLENHAGCAVRSALEMLDQLHEINRSFADQGLPEIDVGVGVNTGKCIVGNMGSKVRFDYTAIGDAVNLASRLEGLCKTYHCRVIISEFTANCLDEELLLRRLDRVRVKGKQESVAIFEPMRRNEKNEVLCRHFVNAMDLYSAGNFAEAKAAFTQLETEYNDPVSSVFSGRCRDFQQAPPEVDWDGVHTLTDK